MKPQKNIGTILLLTGAGIFLSIVVGWAPAFSEKRNEVSYLRGPYNTAFFWRHTTIFRTGSALHFSHAKQHDVLLLTPFSDHESVDARFDAESVAFLKQKRAKTEPTQEYYAPYTARAHWDLLRAIDWTHMLHEQTYDIMSDKNIPWNEKKEWIDRSVRYYLEKTDIPRSPAPLDVTMRRTGAMMKPYFTLFRNYYPKSNDFFYGAHWWHPIIYEAMMIGGNGPGQEKVVRETEAIFIPQVLQDRPQRMLLLREAAPRYSRLSPESANIFDNLHMLHGLAYDILAYEGWSMEQKKAELDRVIKALGYQPGDEKLARKFKTPYPEMDSRVYYDWMRGGKGEMSRIMMEMMEEMMPMMMPEGIPEKMREKMMAQLKMKMKPGLQEGELLGSWMDAMHQMMPEMKMEPDSMAPGKTSKKMIDAMLRGWEEKHGDMPDIAPMPMERAPVPPASAKATG